MLLFHRRTVHPSSSTPLADSPAARAAMTPYRSPFTTDTWTAWADTGEGRKWAGGGLYISGRGVICERKIAWGRLVRRAQAEGGCRPRERAARA